MSGMAPGQVGIFEVWEMDDDEDDEALIGRVECDAAFRLAILDVEPARRAALQAAVDRVNGKEAITRIVPPGPDTARFALGSETVGRDTHGFPAALQEHLVKYFGLRLA